MKCKVVSDKSIKYLIFYIRIQNDFIMKYLIAITICYVFLILTIKGYPFENKLKKLNSANLLYRNNTTLCLTPIYNEINSIRDSLADSAGINSKNRNYKSIDSEKVKSGNILADKFNGGEKIIVPKWYDMITNLPHDMVKFYNKDIRLEKAPIYLGIAAITTGLILIDDKMWRASNKFYNQSQFNKNISDLFVEVGDGKAQFGIAGAFAIYGWISKDKLALTTASEVVEAVLATGAVVQLLKHITGRQSPFVSSKPGGVWKFFPNQIDYHKHVPFYDAFPSGHLATSLAAFTVIAKNYPKANWIRPVTYTITAMLAVSMVNQGIHWYSDYPLAMFLGYEFGNIISLGGKEAKANINEKTQLYINPFVSPTGPGLKMTYVF